MRSSRLLGFVVTVIGAALLVTTALSVGGMGDYLPGGPVSGDNAAPAIAALAHGHIAGLFSHQPTMGLSSLVLRAPVYWLVQTLGGSQLLIYQLGAFVCMLPLALLVAWLVVREPRTELSRGAALLAGVVLLMSPVLQDALVDGHPESVLKGVLSIVAVLAAIAGRDRWAGVLLGLAVGAKPDGVVAVLPVLIVLPGRRLWTAAIAAAVAAPLVVAAPLADLTAFRSALHGEGVTHVVNDLSLWWPFSSTFHLPGGALAPARSIPFGLSRSGASIVALAAILPLTAWGCLHARRRGGTFDALALLALFGVVRCLSDSTHLEYYYLSALMPLVVWEVVSLGRLPLLSIVATAVVVLLSDATPGLDPVAVNAASVGGTFLLGWYLSQQTFAPEPRRVAFGVAPGARKRVSA